MKCPKCRSNNSLRPDRIIKSVFCIMCGFIKYFDIEPDPYELGIIEHAEIICEVCNGVEIVSKYSQKKRTCRACSTDMNKMKNEMRRLYKSEKQMAVA